MTKAWGEDNWPLDSGYFIILGKNEREYVHASWWQFPGELTVPTHHGPWGSLTSPTQWCNCMWRVHWHHQGAFSVTSSSPPSPTEREQFPDNLLASPVHLLGMELIAVCIWLSSLLWSMVLIFPYKWGAEGTTCMPLISFSLWRSPPMRSKVIQDLLEESWFPVFFCFLCFPSFSFRNPVQLLRAPSCSFIESLLFTSWQGVPNPRFSFSPLFSRECLHNLLSQTQDELK